MDNKIIMTAIISVIAGGIVAPFVNTRDSPYCF